METTPTATALPDELTSRDRWVCHNAEKEPLQARTGHLASSKDPATWADCATACANAHRFAGLGFVLGDGITGVDLDGCRDPNTGLMEEWAAEIVSGLGSYAEVSPSGTGVHVLVLGAWPERVGHVKRMGKGRRKVEVYQGEPVSAKYFTVTGDHLPGTPVAVMQRQGELDALATRLFPPVQAASTAPPSAPVNLDDAALIEKAMSAANGAEFRALWEGRPDDNGGHNGGDLSLCKRLAFWTGRDPDRMDRLFRQSARYRDKWERRDYREATIGKACAECTETYTGGRPRAEATDPADSPLLRFPTTDSGNAEAFAHLYGDRVRFDHCRQRWLAFCGHRWQRDLDGELMRLAKGAARRRFDAATAHQSDDLRKWAFQSEGRARMENALALARNEAPVSDRGEDWDADPWLLGCPNGVVDLRTATLRPGRPEDRITRNVAVDFDRQARCVRWDRFLCEVFGEDSGLLEFIWRAAGYTFTGLMTEQAFFLCHGTGANGKSVFLTTLRTVAGDYGADTGFATFEHSNRQAIPADVAALEGVRIVTASETGESSRLNEARLKAWTGSDAMTVRFLHRNFFTFRPEGKLWLACNHRPAVHDASEAFWRRARLVPFRQQFVGDRCDPHLEEALRNELPGILRWAVEGAAAWAADGLTAPQAVMAASDAWRQDADELGEFLAGMRQGDGLRISAGELYAAYADWAKTAGIPEKQRMTATRFGKRMGERFGKTRTYYQGKQQGVYSGIAAAPSQVDQFG